LTSESINPSEAKHSSTALERRYGVFIMAKISAVVITRNEEAQVAECLKRVKWADEIIVMDDESTDRTVEIAREYTDKIFVRKANNNLTEQRNLGAGHASNEWILQLDADEHISEDNAREIRELINNPGQSVAFRFKRRNHFLGHFMRYGGWYHDYIRVYYKDKCHYTGMIHETLKIEGEVGQAKTDIDHFPFKSIHQYLERQFHYTAQGAKDILDKRGVLDKKEIRYNLGIRPLKLIWKSYIKKKGYREGIYGLVVAVLDAFGHFSTWAKYWELIKNRESGIGNSEL